MPLLVSAHFSYMSWIRIQICISPFGSGSDFYETNPDPHHWFFHNDILRYSRNTKKNRHKTQMHKKKCVKGNVSQDFQPPICSWFQPIQPLINKYFLCFRFHWDIWSLKILTPRCAWHRRQHFRLSQLTVYTSNLFIHVICVKP